MNRNMKGCLVACFGALFSLAGCGSEDDGIESATERLQPASNACMTSDTCPYGHCTTEDGTCNRDPNCTPGISCPVVGCYGICVPTPSSR
jgi:hypothetical protein